MKKILLILLCTLTLSAKSQVKISQLTEATTISTSDLFLLTKGDASRKITYQNLAKSLFNPITYPLRVNYSGDTLRIGFSGDNAIYTTSQDAHTFNKVIKLGNDSLWTAIQTRNYLSTHGVTSLTTTGTSGAATLTSNVLNIPVYNSAVWGNITGTLSAQTDLQSALNSKQDTGFISPETDPVVKAINGIIKSDGATISAASSGVDYVIPNDTVGGSGTGKIQTGYRTDYQANFKDRIKYNDSTIIYIPNDKINFPNNLFIGGSSSGRYLLHTTGITGQNNTSIGNGLKQITTGNNNTAIGNNSLNNLTEGIRNVGLGANTLAANTTGNDNIAIGTNIMSGSQTGSSNVAIGSLSALFANTTGSYNIALGGACLSANSTGNYNFALGLRALKNNTTGNNNIAIGDSALLTQTAQGKSIAIGHQSGYSNSSGERLYIENSNSQTPLIGGKFDTDQLGINKLITSTWNRTLNVGGDIDATGYYQGNDTLISKAEARLLLSGSTSFPYTKTMDSSLYWVFPNNKSCSIVNSNGYGFTFWDQGDGYSESLLTGGVPDGSFQTTLSAFHKYINFVSTQPTVETSARFDSSGFRYVNVDTTHFGDNSLISYRMLKNAVATMTSFPYEKVFDSGQSLNWTDYSQNARFSISENETSFSTNYNNPAYSQFRLNTSDINSSNLLFANSTNLTYTEALFDSSGFHYIQVDTSKFGDNSLVSKRWTLDRINKASSFPYTKTLDSTMFWETIGQNNDYKYITLRSKHIDTDEEFGGTSYGSLETGGGFVRISGDKTGFNSNDSYGSYLETSSLGVVISHTGDKIVSFKSSETEKAFIDSSGNIEVTTASQGIILKSPDGTRYKITVANGGTLTVTAL